MTAGREWKVILLFTLPIMAGNLLQQLYNTMDGIIVGNFVGESAFAAVGTTQPLTLLFLALATGLSVGVGIVVSQYFGAKKHDELPVAIDTAVILLGVCGLAFTIIAFITTPMLLRTLLDVPQDILPMSILYFRIYALGLFFQFVYNGIAAVLRGLGDSRSTLYFLAIAMVFNTLLTLLFVVVFKWGVAGAASATVAAQALCVAISFIYLRKRFPYVKAESHWNRGISLSMVRLGLPIAIQMGIISIGNGSMYRLVNGFSDSTPGIIAAYSSAMRLDALIYVPIMGFQSGLASFTGQNMGAGRLDRVRRGFAATLIMSTIVTVTLCILMYIFAESVVGFFGLEAGALAIGVENLRFMAMFFWLFSCYIVLGGVLQGAGDTILQSAATLTALVVRIVAGYTAVHMGWLGYEAAWVVTPVGWMFAIVIAYTRYFTGGWKRKAIAGTLQHEKGQREDPREAT